MKKKVLFSIKPVVDESFLSSYWGYNISTTLKEVINHFKSQFKELKIEFSYLPIEKWEYRFQIPIDYPRALLAQLPVGSFEKMVKYLVDEINKIFSERTEGEKLKKVFKKNLRGKSKEYQMLYLTGYLEGVMEHIIFDDLKKNKPPSDIVIGFTGKILAFYGLTAKPVEIVGTASPKKSAILMTLCSNPTGTLLHEIGHIFGATHVNQDINSVMTPIYRPDKTLLFDHENKERIRESLTKILQKESV